jgi:hypothetical protein
MKSRVASRTAGALAVAMAVTSPVFAQVFAQGPGTGPTDPTPTNPMSKDGATMVINPTSEECARGWQPGGRWSADQFKAFCTKLGASK